MESEDMRPDHAALLEVATQAAKVGGEVLMRYLRDGVEMSDKTASGGKSYDLVSDADLESEESRGRSYWFRPADR